MQNKDQTDETISDTSRRSAMLRLTSMVSTAFLTPATAMADDEAEMFAEESDDIEEFLFDEDEEDLSISYAPTTLLQADTYASSEAAVDPWEKFTPRVVPNDQSALSGAFTSNSPPPVVPVRLVPESRIATQTQYSTIPPQEKLDTDHMDAGSLFALSFPVMVLGGAAYTFEKEKSIITNEHVATGTPPKVKIVMVENKPYGLDVGRRYYNGVNIVREYCDATAPKASNECVNGIAGYLENVSTTGGTNAESQETASAIISYLDGLSSGGQQTKSQPQATGAAFSSYLQSLSEGSIRAPTSAESVAVYLDSLTTKDDFVKLQSRVDAIESSMEDKVTKELDKIAAFLVEQNSVDRNAYSRIQGNGSIANDYSVNGSGLNGYSNLYIVNSDDVTGDKNGYNVNGSGGQTVGNGIGTDDQVFSKRPWL